MYLTFRSLASGEGPRCTLIDSLVALQFSEHVQLFDRYASSDLVRYPSITAPTTTEPTTLGPRFAPHTDYVYTQADRTGHLFDQQ